MRTVVTFESSIFNTQESRDYFINPGCFGDDLAKWLIDRLRAAGFHTNEDPEQEDFGWYFEFHVPEGKHSVVLGFRSGDPKPNGCWIAFIERSRGFLGSLLGQRKREIAATAMSALHAALQAPEIRNVRWHEQKDFDAREDLGVSNP
jgi:hypothetical protein